MTSIQKGNLRKSCKDYFRIKFGVGLICNKILNAIFNILIGINAVTNLTGKWINNPAKADFSIQNILFNLRRLLKVIEYWYSNYYLIIVQT